MDYKERLNSYYREKSKQETKKPSKKQSKAVKIIPLDRIPFQDIRSRMKEVKEVIHGLEELAKRYEMDISYDLHDTLQEFDQVNHKLEQARTQYNELVSMKDKKEAALREEHTKAQDALSRLLDTYRKTDDLTEKKDIYRQQRPFQQKMLSRFMREMKEDGDEFRLFTLYRPIQEIKL